MVDTTISPDGGNRFKYILKRCAGIAGLLLLCALMACDSSETQDTAILDSQVASLQALLNSSGNNVVPSLAPVKFPEDASLHPDAQTESLQLRAILYDGNGDSVGISSQIARLALQAPDTPVSDVEQTSEWSYNQVAVSELQVQSSQALGLEKRYQRAQRVTLDLAGSIERKLWVGGDALSVENTQNCSRNYTLQHRLDAEQSFELRWRLPDCPEITSLRSARSWTGYVSDIQGAFKRTNYGAGQTSDLVENTLQGVAWMTQFWGAMPDANAAVLLDQLELSIEGLGLLYITRSKRRSGQGPRTVATRWLQEPTSNAVQKNPAALSISWEDVFPEQSDNARAAVPEEIVLRSDDDLMHWRITPLYNRESNRSVSESAYESISGRQWTTAIQITGSHAGVGFLRYQVVR